MTKKRLRGLSKGILVPVGREAGNRVAGGDWSLQGWKGMGQAYCWCRAVQVWVPFTEIRAGTTRSCGRRTCHA